MESIQTRIIDGLCEIFTETENLSLTADTVLGELPDWDSMAAVNLQTFLHQEFNIEVPLELLADETAIHEIAAFVQNPVPNQAAL